ncbi:MAG: leucine-rich repeat protein [Oscillospiraceae bacterium]|nr:leucine-rich repeat protein [Oscillospiraceae bacterium]
MKHTELIQRIMQSLSSPLWGKWEIRDELPSGPDCAVYRLEARRMNRIETSALKVVPILAAGTFFSEEQRQTQLAAEKERAELESDLLYQMQDCPYIVTYQDEDLQPVQEDGQLLGYAYLIRMELPERLTDRILAGQFDLSERSVIQLADDIAAALDCAHSRGVTHRNIHPDHIYIAANGTAKLGDFRIPKRAGVIRAFTESEMYIAPEVFATKTAAEFTVQADLYSLGICLYQLMNGMYLPFERELGPDEAWEKRMSGETFPLPRNASDDFAAVILKACASDAAERYQSAAEFREALLFRGRQSKSARIAGKPEDGAETDEPDPSVQGTEDSDDQSVPAELDAAIARIMSLPDDDDTDEVSAEDEPAEADAEEDEPAEAEAEEDEPAEAEAEEEEPAEAEAEEEEPAEADAEEDEPAEAEAEEEEPAEADAEEDEPAEAAAEEDEAAEEEPAAEQTKKVSIAEQIASKIPSDMEQNPDNFELAGSVLKQYHGKAARIALPNGITEIGNGAFADCDFVHEIVLPEGITRIGERAFAGCTALSRTSFPQSLRLVGNEAFKGCVSLREAKFRGSLTQVGVGAFSGCTGLEAAVFDCPIEKIGYDAFYGCSSLTEFSVGSNSFSYKSVGGVLFDYDCKHLVRYPAGKPNRDYTVPDGVVTILDGAFYGCGRLERIVLSKDVKLIGSSAFRECTALKTITLPENLETIKNSAFQGCKSLVRMELPAYVAYIGAYAFSHCTKLSAVTLPPKLTELCLGVFEACSVLKSIVLPDSMIKIGEKAFLHSGLTEHFVPYSTTRIEKLSFAECGKLRYIFLSNRINQIATNAFENCSASLTIFGLTGSVPEEFAEKRQIKFERMFALESGAGAGSYTLRKYYGVFSFITLPPDVNIIGEEAFMDCRSLRRIIIPSGVGEIGASAFARCENLEAVSMTNLVMRIGEHAFDGCAALKQFQVHDMSGSFPLKVQRKIHRNFYKVLKEIQPESAEAYAEKYNVTQKSSFLDMSFSRTLKKETQEHVRRLAVEYEETEFISSLYGKIQEEMRKSERMLSNIELFSDCAVTTGIMSGQPAKHKFLYRDLDAGVRMLPNVNHMLACATVIVSMLGGAYCLSPTQGRDSAEIKLALN